MKVRFLSGFLFFLCISQLPAQQRCAVFEYTKQSLLANPRLANNQQQIESFIQSVIKKRRTTSQNARPGQSLIRIPIVVHIVYHLKDENIADEAIASQVAALNRDYQRKNPDSTNTPGDFKPVAADCGIQFELAKVDPVGRATTGIERTYSPITRWTIEGDNVKFRANYGADGWDPQQYLNIWVCNLDDLLGYSSVLGDKKEKDGVVINYTVFNNLDDGGAYNSGRTAVHEIGHWLGLKHLWGDAYCGDDDVMDTPSQGTFTTGCPGGVRLSCNNSPTGDMYMNFMDYTNDPCMNLFTNGQGERMRSLFETGGWRNSLLSSKALGTPWALGIPSNDDEPQWLYTKLYPVPAASALILDTRYDPRWVGQELTVTNSNGQVMMRHIIKAKIETINIANLNRGIYFIHGAAEGLKMAGKFIKM